MLISMELLSLKDYNFQILNIERKLFVKHFGLKYQMREGVWSSTSLRRFVVL